MITQLSYDLTIGEEWERLVVVKDQRTHRIRKVTSSAATIQGPGGVPVPIDTSISFEGGITLCLSAAQTYALSPGTYLFDVVANPLGVHSTVAQGTIDVVAIDRVTLLGSEYDTIVHTTGSDTRLTFLWTDTNGSPMPITSATFVVTDSNDAPVIMSSTITYAVAGEILLHIDDVDTTAPGNYNYVVTAMTGTDTHIISSGLLVIDTAI